MLLTYLALTALARTTEGSPFALRYMFPTVFLLLVILVAVAPRDNLKIAYPVGLTVLIAIVLPHNLRQLVDGSNHLKESAVITRAELGAIELSREFVPLDVTMDLHEYPIPASNYLTAVDRFESSPAYDRTELMAAPELARQNADRLLALAESLVTPAGAGSAGKLIARGNFVCRRVSPGDTFTRDKLGISEILVLGSWPETGIAVKRYASDFQLLALPDQSGRYVIGTPDAAADPPWQIKVEASGSPVRVCETG
ncbi:MAG: hypothetical protein IPK93_05935 [Solirubrobacterales bacterium]|nr:hypothetical protein [Solirubrobacterales bacterium]